MAKRSDISCGDCYFRQEGLCALATETPCPTFRLAGRGRLTPPRQAQLMPLLGAGEAERTRAAERDLPLRPAYA